MLVERLVFFEGMVYQIEEEIYSESDHSSVYTSEDSFEEDDTLQKKYKKFSPLLSAYDAESNNLNATMTSIGFTVAGRKNLDKIEGYPAPETPDESTSRSDITAKQVNISDDASEDKSENNQDDKSNNNPEDKSDNSASESASPTRNGDETPTKSKKDAKSKGKKGKDD